MESIDLNTTSFVEIQRFIDLELLGVDSTIINAILNSKSRMIREEVRAFRNTRMKLQLALQRMYLEELMRGFSNSVASIVPHKDAHDAFLCYQALETSVQDLEDKHINLECMLNHGGLTAV